MTLDGRQLGGVQRVEQGHRRMGIGAGIDDDCRIALARGLDAVDQHALVIALGEFDNKVQALGLGAARRLDVRQRLMAVDLRLTLSQHVEVRPVQNQHRL